MTIATSEKRLLPDIIKSDFDNNQISIIPGYPSTIVTMEFIDIVYENSDNLNTAFYITNLL